MNCMNENFCYEKLTNTNLNVHNVAMSIYQIIHRLYKTISKPLGTIG